MLRGEGMALPVVLWLDLKVYESSDDLASLLHGHCEVRRTSESITCDDEINGANPSLLCIEYDYPDRASLKLLEKIKRLF